MGKGYGKYIKVWLWLGNKNTWLRELTVTVNKNANVNCRSMMGGLTSLFCICIQIPAEKCIFTTQTVFPRLISCRQEQHTFFMLPDYLIYLQSPCLSFFLSLFSLSLYAIGTSLCVSTLPFFLFPTPSSPCTN